MTQHADATRERAMLLKVLDDIRKSSLADFESPLEWGQWCRDVAIEATMSAWSNPAPTPSPATPAAANDCPQCRKAWDSAKAEWDAGGSPPSPPAFCTHTHDAAPATPADEQVSDLLDAYDVACQAVGRGGVLFAGERRSELRSRIDAALASPTGDDAIDTPGHFTCKGTIGGYESSSLHVTPESACRYCNQPQRKHSGYRSALPTGDDALLTRLEEIEARANAATPGQWGFDDGITDEGVINGEPYITRGKLAKVEVVLFGPQPDGANYEHVLIADMGIDPEYARREANGRFIAHAREDVPYLLEQLRARLAASPRPAAAEGGAA